MSTAHLTSQRRTLAGPDPNKALPLDPAPKSHPKPINPNPDSIPSSFSSSLSNRNYSLSKSLNYSETQKTRTPQKPISDKAMSVSAMVEKSRNDEKCDGKVISLVGFDEELKKKKKKEKNLVSGGGRRRSFGVTHVDLADVFASNGVKVVSVDMPPVMQIHAVELARKVHDSLEKFTSKTLASTLKREFDEVYGPAWHCIVGTSFGSFVTHSVGGFLYFSMDQKLYILLFKTTVQRAD